MKQTILLMTGLVAFAFQGKAQNPLSSGPIPAPNAMARQEAAPPMLAEMEFAEVDNLHDFGTIPEGPDVTHEFRFRNSGNAPLIISNANANCGCTSPIFPKEPIAPGKTGKISVTYHTAGHPGNFEKFVFVTSNAGGQSQITLRIKGIVLRKQP
jgi:hypothetical protein